MKSKMKQKKMKVFLEQSESSDLLFGENFYF